MVMTIKSVRESIHIPRDQAKALLEKRGAFGLRLGTRKKVDLFLIPTTKKKKGQYSK